MKTTTLTGWEDDLSEPRANKLSMMAGLLNVSIIWLLTGEGEGTPAPAEGDDSGDIAGILAELREIRAAMRATSERAARLEKRLRTLVQAQEAAE